MASKLNHSSCSVSAIVSSACSIPVGPFLRGAVSCLPTSRMQFTRLTLRHSYAKVVFLGKLARIGLAQFIQSELPPPKGGGFLVPRATIAALPRRRFRRLPPYTKVSNVKRGVPITVYQFAATRADPFAVREA